MDNVATKNNLDHQDGRLFSEQAEQYNNTIEDSVEFDQQESDRFLDNLLEGTSVTRSNELSEYSVDKNGGVDDLLEDIQKNNDQENFREDVQPSDTENNVEEKAEELLSTMREEVAPEIEFNNTEENAQGVQEEQRNTEMHFENGEIITPFEKEPEQIDFSKESMDQTFDMIINSVESSDVLEMVQHMDDNQLAILIQKIQYGTAEEVQNILAGNIEEYQELENSETNSSQQVSIQDEPHYQELKDLIEKTTLEQKESEPPIVAGAVTYYREKGLPLLETPIMLINNKDISEDGLDHFSLPGYVAFDGTGKKDGPQEIAAKIGTMTNYESLKGEKILESLNHGMEQSEYPEEQYAMTRLEDPQELINKDENSNVEWKTLGDILRYDNMAMTVEDLDYINKVAAEIKKQIEQEEVESGS